jgi:hypothetical protein
MVALLATGCGAGQHDPCGAPIEPGSTEMRTCEGPREVCICATSSCAVQEFDPDGCRSGFRYVDTELADERYRGECVERDLIAWKVDGDDDVKECVVPPPDGGTPDAGVDAPIDAPAAPLTSAVLP